MDNLNAHFHRKIIWAGSTLAHYGVIVQKELPWRQKRTPYRIFLAEMLLVRTRVDVVARIYESVFSKYPNIFRLANTEENNLAEALHPLGLPKRVPYIIKAARYICENCNGEIPSDVKSLLSLPGLGIYTAVAIAVFAYNQKLVPGDVNILRFIARLTGLKMENKTKGSKQLRELAPFLSEEGTGLSTEKLLDFTRLICRPRNPLCKECYLTRHCSYFRDLKQ